MKKTSEQVVDMHKPHSHRCQECGTIWTHGEMMASDVEAHTCPKCSKPGVWRIYRGGQEHAVGAIQPKVCHGGGSVSLFNNPLFLLYVLMLSAVIAGTAIYHILTDRT